MFLEGMDTQEVFLKKSPLRGLTGLIENKSKSCNNFPLLSIFPSQWPIMAHPRLGTIAYPKDKRLLKLLASMKLAAIRNGTAYTDSHSVSDNNLSVFFNYLKYLDILFFQKATIWISNMFNEFLHRTVINFKTPSIWTKVV